MPDMSTIDWKLLGAIVVSEVLLLWAFGAWWILANPWFWAFHITTIIVYLFLREPNEKKKNMVVSKSGWLLFGTLVVAFLVINFGYESGSSTPSIATAKQKISSHLPFGDSTQEENEGMKERVVKFWQDNLSDDAIGQYKMLGIANNATRFNHSEPNGRTIRREVDGRYKIGVMSIDQGLWSWAGVGSGVDISTTDGNLKGALYFYKKYKTLAWTRAEKIHPRSLVISVPANGETEEFAVSNGSSWYPSGDVRIVTEKGKSYVDGPDRRISLEPLAKRLKFSSASGQSEIVVLNK